MNAPVAPDQLLAKSPHATGPVTLEQHLLDTEEAAMALFSGDSRWARSFPRFFKLHAADSERFLLHLRLAALFHDIGKANVDFQKAVTSSRAVLQALRHEHLSAIILHLPQVRQWLTASPHSVDLDILTAATLSHHFQASEQGDNQWGQPRGSQWLIHHLDHAEVRNILRRVAEVVGLDEPPTLPKEPWGPRPPWQTALQQGRRAAQEFRRAVGKDSRRRALLLAVKAGLIAADAAASGLVREGQPIREWIAEVVGMPALTPEDISRHILEPRAEQIRKRTGSFSTRRFQELAAEQGRRALLLAACGSGKTLAAWKWAEAQVRENDIGRVIFLYPTRGTATEGFRDYVGWAPEDQAELLHGHARYELEGLRANPAESTRGKTYTDEAAERLFSLARWPRRYFSATADQFLAFLEHSHPSTCLLPVLADSALIIDEVHSFDQRMFKDLVAFLQEFDLPVLCMTATLPASRRKALEDLGLRVYPTPEHREQLEDLGRQESHHRYRLEPAASEQEAMAVAREAFRNDQRVLWVVNQVARCQRLAQALGEHALCYHSRFRLEDRQRAHQRTVEAFKQSERPALAVTTQVCEMSLDLDADVLITELAPPSALIQRFGRANRHLAQGADFRARLLFYEPEGPLPYTREELQAARNMLQAVGLGDVSQRRLAEALEQHALGEARPDGSALFTTAGYYATPGSFRDVEGFTHACVLDEDIPRLREALAARKPYEGLLVPVPRRSVLPEESRPAGLPTWLGVARAAAYDRRLGFLTEEAGA